MAQYSYGRLKPEYTRLWNEMFVTKTGEAVAEAKTVIAHKDRYLAVERTEGVPWFVIGCMHMRESDGSFRTWLHNGDPMRNRAGQAIRTRNVPAGRPPNPNVTWEEGAEDALDYEHLEHLSGWCPEMVAYSLEKFNGWGYRSPARNIPSPYLWGGTSVQKRGKFVRDGVYSSSTMDPQLGGMAVLKQIMKLDPTARFVSGPVAVSTPPKPVVVVPPPPLPPPAPEPEPPVSPPTTTEPPPSPKAIDTESSVKPLVKSKTMWGGGITLLTGGLAAIQGLASSLDNPYALSGFGILVILLCAGGYLVFKGRLDVDAIVKHLAVDDTAGTPT